MENKPVIKIKNLNKVYANGFQALQNIDLSIHKGEIFGLLGPNGAGKTTLINIIAGLTRKTSGEVSVLGRDVEKDYRFTRSKIGLVQQELNNDPFFKVREIVRLQAGYFGVPNPDDQVEDILKKVSLWEKRNQGGRTLSGGMKRRVMIAKALVHNPKIIFLDEPTAGVDVELRANLWNLVKSLRDQGKTIILTTHYLEEAEELADRVAIINHGQIVLVESKKDLIKHGSKLHDIYLEVVQEKVVVEG
ncbi:MAG: ABC transporter ATP-binding protein [Candidatus Colwellbacteria bacterium]|nr:ABC transporter ATP-binding protein [Candidatus Colwellbacteria bacterium]